MKFIPKSLNLLFVAQVFERISFFTLLMFLVNILNFYFGMKHHESIFVYHTYLSLGLLLTIIGGIVADFILGYYESTLIGLILIVFGNSLLVIYTDYLILLTALSFIIIGNAFIKPALMVIVGQSYELTDNNRDIGFTLLYITNHIGYIIAGIAALYFYEFSDVQVMINFTFVLSLLSVIICIVAIKFYRQSHIICRYKIKSKIKYAIILLLVPALLSANIFVLNRQVNVKVILFCASIIVLGYTALGLNMLKYGYNRSNMLLVMGYFILTALFGSCFYVCLQFFTSYLLELAGWFRHIYLVIILIYSIITVLLAPWIALLWQRYANHGRDISNAYKFLIGLSCILLALLCCSIISSNLFEFSSLIVFGMIILVILFAACAEICIIPVGMSLVSRLASTRFPAIYMSGLTFMLGMGSVISLLIGFNSSRLSQKFIEYHYLFYDYSTVLAIVIGVYVLLLPIIKLIHGDR